MRASPWSPLVWLCLLASSACLTAQANPSQAIQDESGARPRPHVIVVLADDLGLGDVGAYNPDSKIPTPHLDRLAHEGRRFTDAHSASAVCTPSRYALLTGRYAWRTRLTSWVFDGESTNLIDPERVTLPDALSALGYRTACIGKWHLGLGLGDTVDWSAPLRPGPVDHGFDTFYGIPASLDMPPYVYVLDDRPVQPADEQVAGSGHRRQGGGGFWRAGPVARDFRHAEVLPRCTERAVEFIERATRDDPERPFFLYLPLSAPHTPWLPGERWQGTSGAGHYGDFVAQVDDTVGALLDTLDRLELADDTLVIVTSDNGSHWPTGDIERYGHAANLHLRGQKADVWEGGHRVPFVLRWPGRVPAGTVSDTLLVLTDVLPSLAGLTGVSLDDATAEDGFDLSAEWAGAEGAPTRPHAVHHSADGMFAVRKGRWKLIEGLGSGGFTAPRRREPEGEEAPGQLYDLVADPGEATNVYAAQPEVVAELTALLDALRADPGG